MKCFVFVRVCVCVGGGTMQARVPHSTEAASDVWQACRQRPRTEHQRAVLTWRPHACGEVCVNKAGHGGGIREVTYLHLGPQDAKGNRRHDVGERREEVARNTGTG